MGRERKIKEQIRLRWEGSLRSSCSEERVLCGGLSTEVRASSNRLCESKGPRGTREACTSFEGPEGGLV